MSLPRRPRCYRQAHPQRQPARQALPAQDRLPWRDLQVFRWTSGRNAAILGSDIMWNHALPCMYLLQCMYLEDLIHILLSLLALPSIRQVMEPLPLIVMIGMSTKTDLLVLHHGPDILSLRNIYLFLQNLILKQNHQPSQLKDYRHHQSLLLSSAHLTT